MPHHLVGYARVSTLDQKLHLQLDALRSAGCDRLFTDHVSGAKAERPGLLKALDYVRRGDTLVVWRLGVASGARSATSSRRSKRSKSKASASAPFKNPSTRRVRRASW